MMFLSKDDAGPATLSSGSSLLVSEPADRCRRDFSPWRTVQPHRRCYWLHLHSRSRSAGKKMRCYADCSTVLKVLSASRNNFVLMMLAFLSPVYLPRLLFYLVCSTDKECFVNVASLYKSQSETRLRIQRNYLKNEAGKLCFRPQMPARPRVPGM